MQQVYGGECYFSLRSVRVIKMMSHVYICLGSDGHQDQLTEASRDTGGTIWTINRSARPGDRVVFYIKRPISAFIAVGRVESKPYYIGDPGEDWYGHFMAPIGNLRMLPHYVFRFEAMSRFPNWGYLIQPRKSVRVPDEIADEFWKFVLGKETRKGQFANEGDVEGLKTEVVQYVNKRSRRLRAIAFQRARGVCAVCRRDFSKVLRGRGVRVLQVHHRRQLSVGNAPRVTRVNDLVVVCANCHLLLHLDPRRALSVEKLREMLRNDPYEDYVKKRR